MKEASSLVMVSSGKGQTVRHTHADIITPNKGNELRSEH